MPLVGLTGPFRSERGTEAVEYRSISNGSRSSPDTRSTPSSSQGCPDVRSTSNSQRLPDAQPKPGLTRVSDHNRARQPSPHVAVRDSMPPFATAHCRSGPDIADHDRICPIARVLSATAMCLRHHSGMRGTAEARLVTCCAPRPTSATLGTPSAKRHRKYWRAASLGFVEARIGWSRLHKHPSG